MSTFDPGPLLEVARNLVGDTDMAIGELVGVADRSVARWRKGSRLTEFTADRCAVRLGLHPCLLWPEWFQPENDRREALTL